MPLKLKNFSVFLVYALFFGLLFLQFPLTNTLPGNFDTWFGIAFTNGFINYLEALITGQEAGTSLYPISNYFTFGESGVLVMSIISFFKWISGSDLWAIYGLITLIYSSTAFSVYLLARHIVQLELAALMAGFFFMAANFTFAHIDSPHTLFFLLGFLSIHWLLVWLNTKQLKPVVLSAIALVLQLYISAYAFLLVATIIAVILVFRLSSIRLRGLIVFSALVIIGILPFFRVYFLQLQSDSFYRPLITIMESEGGSLELQDLTRPLPNNLLYPDPEKIIARDLMYTFQLADDKGWVKTEYPSKDLITAFGSIPKMDDISGWVSIRRSAFIGISMWLLAIIGWLKYKGKHRWWIRVLLILGIVVALGPFIRIGSTLIPLPDYWVYKWWPTALFFRVPMRAFFISLLAISLLAAYAINWLLTEKPKMKWLVPLIAILFFVENISFPMMRFDASYLKVPIGLEFLNKIDKSNQVVLHLPAKTGFSCHQSDKDLFEYNREIIYMYWQTQIKHNSINGVHGYLPKSRLQYQQFIDFLPSRVSISELKKAGVTMFCYHPHMVLETDKLSLKALKNSPYLVLMDESEDAVCFWVK